MLDKNDILYLMRCFDLARLGNGNTSPNPSVGSVIVAQNRIIGEGFHQKCGEAHAEVNAVAAVSDADTPLLVGATIYVSLEPCHHFGKTPPCVDLILDKKIPRVVIAATDPFELVAGKSIEKLRKHGVEVVLADPHTPALAAGLRHTLGAFFRNVQQKRPYIILKWATSADGFMGNNAKRVAISNAYTQRLSHKWRSEIDAILIGTNTAALDDAALSNRFYFGKNPVRIVIDRQKRLPKNLKIFDGSVPTIIFADEKYQYTEGGGKNVEYVYIDFSKDALEMMLVILFEKKIRVILVEGGATLLNSFIEKDLWDEVRIFKSAKTIEYDNNNVAAPILKYTSNVNEMQIADNHIVIVSKDI